MPGPVQAVRETKLNSEPGRHFDHHHGLPQTVNPADAKVTTVIESDGPFPRLGAWVPSCRVSAGQLVELNAVVVDESEDTVEGAQLSFVIAPRGNAGAALQGTLQPDPASPGKYCAKVSLPEPTAAVAEYDFVVYSVVNDARVSPSCGRPQAGFKYTRAWRKSLLRRQRLLRWMAICELPCPSRSTLPATKRSMLSFGAER